MSGARPDTWMPLYWGDYLRDTAHLSAAEHGAYFLLIGHYWTNGGPFPDDDTRLARVTRLSPKEWKAIRPAVADFFATEGGVWQHDRIDGELAKAIARTEAKAKAGRKGAAKRWQDDGKANGTAMAEPSVCQSQSDAQSQPQSPNPPVATQPSPPPGDKSKSRKRTSRLPDDWQPDEAMIAYAQQKGLSPDETARLRDDIVDWSRSSPNGAKLDWLATWQTWVRRRADERRDGPGRSVGNRSKPASVVAAAHRGLSRGGREHGGAGDALADVWGTGAGGADGGDQRDGGGAATGFAQTIDHGDFHVAGGDEGTGSERGRHGPVERGDGAGATDLSGRRGLGGNPASGAGIDVLPGAGRDRGGVSSPDGREASAASPSGADAGADDLTPPDFLRRRRA